MRTRFIKSLLCLVLMFAMSMAASAQGKTGVKPPPPKQNLQTEKKCGTCKKPISSCAYKGKHPAPERKCAACGKAISKCSYKGTHPPKEVSISKLNVETSEKVIKYNSKTNTITYGNKSYKMVYVEGGEFWMGAPENDSEAYKNEKPAHRVSLSNYYIGQTEVPQWLWTAVMGSNPSNFKGDNRPVENVSWNDCQTFIKKLNSLTGKNFSLPTEAQWEYAARGGKRSRGYKYSGCNYDNLKEFAWFCGNSENQTHDVGTKKANELGLYDMSGNVLEWCSDWYGGYSSESQTNPTGPSDGPGRVARGGSWRYYARSCRVSFRLSSSPGGRNYYLGLRLALRP